MKAKKCNGAELRESWLNDWSWQHKVSVRAWDGATGKKKKQERDLNREPKDGELTDKKHIDKQVQIMTWKQMSINW